MTCPRCQGDLEAVSLKSITLRRCVECRGIWCAAETLSLLKDRESRGDYRWVDVDLWRDVEQFRTGAQEGLACPADSEPLTTVRYGEAPVRVDICAACRGVWLDGGELDKILDFLEQKVDRETLGDYLEDVREEFAGVLTGREGVGEGLSDLGKILYLIELRFGVEHRNVAALLERLSRVPGA